MTAPAATVDDDDDARLQRAIGVYGSIAGGLLCLAWALFLHQTGGVGRVRQDGIREVAWGVTLLLNVAALRVHGRQRWFAWIVVVLELVFPHMLCWSTGSLSVGTPIVFWSLLGPLVAAMMLDARAVVASLLAFVALEAGTAAFMPLHDVETGMGSAVVRIYCAANVIPTGFFVTLTVRFLLSRRERAARALADEHARSEALLLNILPASIARQLKDSSSTIAQRHDEATILFADIVGFTELSARLPPEELVLLLNALFTDFDHLVEKHGLEKIKTIGDAYMVVGGLPAPQPDHARRVADLALDMLEALAARRASTGHALDVRIGINTGPVVAGVIGRKKFIYDLWGDAVNLASRMESHGVKGAVHVSPSTKEALGGAYAFDDRGVIAVKGKGEMRTWLLTGRHA